MEREYTIREIAELLNTDKQTIHNIIRKEQIETKQNVNGKSNSWVCTHSNFEIIKDIYENRKAKKRAVDVIPDETVILKHEIEMLKLEIALKDSIINSKDDLITQQKLTIDFLMGHQAEPPKPKNFPNDFVDGAVAIKEKVVGAVTKKSNNQNPYPEIEQFLIDKGVTIEQLISDQESEQFNINVAENRLTAKERSEFKKQLGQILGHKDSSSTGRTFRTYIKKVLASREQ